VTDDTNGGGEDQEAKRNDAFASLFNATMLEPALLTEGIHPDDLVTLLRYAPLALTSMCWRNSVLEDWHAGPDSRIHDADMMRANVETTRIFHQALWAGFGEPIGIGDLVSRGDFTPEDVDVLYIAFDNALEDAFSPERVLPHGLTLAELGGDQVSELYDHAELQLSSMHAQAEQHGVAVVLMFLALRGRRTADGWWGSPRWPLIVDAFLARLADPTDEYWVRWGPCPEQPQEIADSVRFRHMLLSAPDQLKTETLDFCIARAGLGFIRVSD
jgi:hypothetical protein